METKRNIPASQTWPLSATLLLNNEHLPVEKYTTHMNTIAAEVFTDLTYKVLMSS